jgi:phage major head subunit gpT-like protein
MTFAEFNDSLKESQPPKTAGNLLRALWYDGKGDWDRAHTIVQDIESADAAAVHAYLHRKEGDHSNAAYWYRRARRDVHHGTLEDEWRELVEKELRN